MSNDNTIPSCLDYLNTLNVFEKAAQESKITNDNQEVARLSQELHSVLQNKSNDLGCTPEQLAVGRFVLDIYRVTYFHRVTSLCKTPSDQEVFCKVWGKALSDFTFEEVVSVVEKAIQDSEWPPSLHEVVNLLKSNKLNITLPSPEQAFLEASMNSSNPVNHKWTHPVVYHAGKEVGWFSLRSYTDTSIKSAFTTIYSVLVKKVLDGHVLDLPRTEHDINFVNQTADELAQTNIVNMIIRASKFYKEHHGIEPDVTQNFYSYLTYPEGSIKRQLIAKATQQIKTDGLPFALDLSLLPDL